MIKAESIDVENLPNVLIEEKSNLPTDSGIYLAIDANNKVQYVGIARGLFGIRGRWCQGKHHKEKELQAISSIRIAYILIGDKELLPEMEQALIQWFRPPLNREFLPPKTQFRGVQNRTSVTIPESLLVWFQDYCKKQKRSVSAQISFMIEELKDQEERNK
ncbi:MAG: GIY-YIG nuclease family protein [Richelia sp. RM1_1_1]|nr:GIY-YIG nuclease family protein [Richelia sp. RM1_1_1]